MIDQKNQVLEESFILVIMKVTVGDKENSFGNIDTNEIFGYKKDNTLKKLEIFKVVVYSGDDQEIDGKCVRKKEIKKNFSKKDSDNDNTITIKNAKINTEENEYQNQRYLYLVNNFILFIFLFSW